MTALANFVKMNNLNLQTLYLSNIPEWICSSDKLAWELTQKMIEEVELFPELLLDAFYPTSLKKGSGPPQRISSGKWPTYEVSKKRSGYSLSFYDQSDNGPMLTSPNAVKKRKLYDDAEKEGLSTPCSF